MKKVTCKHNTMIIPKTAYIALAQLSDSDLGKYVRMIFEYGFSDKEPELSPLEAAMLAPIFEFIETNNETYDKLSETKRKAANARWHKDSNAQDADECTCMQMNANDALNININKNTNKDINISVSKDTDSEPVKQKSEKHKYGKFNKVLLTDDEYRKLQEEYPDYNQKIDNLSYYLGSTGKSYKSHYMTILNWARKDKANSRQPLFSPTFPNSQQSVDKSKIQRIG